MFSIFVRLLSFMIIKNIGVIEDLNQAHSCIINIFLGTIPVSRILITFSIIYVVFLKINDNENEKVIENFHDLRANILYMIGSGKWLKMMLIK